MRSKDAYRIDSRVAPYRYPESGLRGGVPGSRVGVSADTHTNTDYPDRNTHGYAWVKSRQSFQTRQRNKPMHGKNVCLFQSELVRRKAFLVSQTCCLIAVCIVSVVLDDHIKLPDSCFPNCSALSSTFDTEKRRKMCVGTIRLFTTDFSPFLSVKSWAALFSEKHLKFPFKSWGAHFCQRFFVGDYEKKLFLSPPRFPHAKQQNRLQIEEQMCVLEHCNFVCGKILLFWERILPKSSSSLSPWTASPPPLTMHYPPVQSNATHEKCNADSTLKGAFVSGMIYTYR